MLGNPTNITGVSPLCDRTSDSQPLYEDDWVASNAIKLLESWAKTAKAEPERPPFFMHSPKPSPLSALPAASRQQARSTAGSGQ